MIPRSLCITLNAIFAIVLLRFEYVLGTCIERDEQLQKYLTSSNSSFSNYFNISKAVYPSVDLPSLLIDITVKFLKTAGKKSNGSSSLSTLEQNVSRSTTFEIRKFKWSMSCLYVSGGISLSAMNWFSLGAIYPNRRGSKLHITLPQFCNSSTVDIQAKMIYFLSTVSDHSILCSVLYGAPNQSLFPLYLTFYSLYGQLNFLYGRLDFSHDELFTFCMVNSTFY